MTNLLRTVVFLVAFLGLSVAEGQTARLTGAQKKAVDEAVEGERKKQEVVGVAIGVLRNGRVVYVKGYGSANRETRRPVTTKTIFNWASNSKPLLAVAAMQLVGRAKLDLEADVRRYVPELPKKKGRITVRHLLSHQSGFPHYKGDIARLPKERIGSEVDPVVALNRFGGTKLIFEPGEKEHYSSYGYVLLSAVVQRAGGLSLIEQLQNRIAEPLGMDSFQLDFPTNGQAHWATGYVRKKDGTIAPAREYAHFWKHGAGGYKSNIVDFARWAEALLNDELVSETIRDRMWTVQKTTSGKTTSYGLGFRVSGEGRGLKVAHGGSHSEVKTRLVLYPERRHGVVIMMNCGYGKPGRVSTATYRALRK